MLLCQAFYSVAGILQFPQNQLPAHLPTVSAAFAGMRKEDALMEANEYPTIEASFDYPETKDKARLTAPRLWIHSSHSRGVTRFPKPGRHQQHDLIGLVPSSATPISETLAAMPGSFFCFPARAPDRTSFAQGDAMSLRALRPYILAIVLTLPGLALRFAHPDLSPIWVAVLSGIAILGLPSC